MQQSTPDAAETCLLLLSGLPGAGKTTLARGLAREACRDGVDARHVCFDELGCQPSGGGGGGGEAAEAFSPEAWQQARRVALAQLELELSGSSSGNQAAGPQQRPQQPLLVEAAPTKPSSQQQDAASSSTAASGTPAEQRQRDHQRRRRRLVIADDNLQYRSMRWQCYGLARAAGAAVLVLHMQCSERLAQERNAARPAGERVPPAVIDRMAAQFEPPGSGSGSGSSSIADWEQACLVECRADQPVDAATVWQLVRRKWGAAAPPPFNAEAAASERAAAQAATAASQAHAVDVATRHVLSQAMRRLASAAPAAKAAAAQQLIAARRQLLQQAASEQVQAAAEGPGAAAGRWAEQFQQRCEALLASLS